ncbi:MAG: sulfatase-like hydrolase/transferase [Candidatus Aminicenantes bacterium]|nr:sulfatase-like hydrolase/transferase [Candidatus Aminicenantes bacterium]
MNLFKAYSKSIKLEMKKGQKIIAIKSLILFMITLSVIQCRLSEGKKYTPYKIIDNLSKENVIESPFKDIIKKFKFVEEDFQEKWQYLPELSNDKHGVWGMSTKHPILGEYDLKTPEKTRLYRNEKIVKKLSKHRKEGWSWIRTSEKLVIKQFKDYNKHFNGVVLTDGDSLEFERFLAQGDVSIDIYVLNRNWKTFRPDLKIYFSDSEVAKITATRKRWFRISNTVKLGKHDIKIKCTVPDGKTADPERDFLIIGMIKILSSSDILLLSKPQSAEKEPPRGKFQLNYYTHEFIPGEKGQLFKNSNQLFLYNFKNEYPLYDLGIENNPYFLKKKIKIIKKIENSQYSLNSLVAPPRSEFTIPLKIQPRSTLELEYGFLKFGKKSSNIINFKIVIEEPEADKVILNKNLSPITNDEILLESIDLSSWASKKVKLSFITEDVTQDLNNKNVLGSMPVWINPIIYQPSGEDDINVILISLDTLRPDHLGYYGYDRDTSRTIDQLAKEGVCFLNTYSTTSWTLPGHISMLTSLNCIRHQVYYPFDKMRVDIETLADFLRVNDYLCAAFTGGGYLSADYGFSKGFDSYQELKLFGKKALRYDEAEFLAEFAFNWLQRNKDRKFFLFLHTYQPHDPYANLSTLGKAYLEAGYKWDKVNMGTLLEHKSRFNTSFSEKEKENIISLYDGEILHTDAFFVKPIMDYLKKLKIYDKTMIILTSDHGEEFYDHEAWLHDHTIYEEGIKIPLIIKFPFSDYKGEKISKIARITDIVPTILDFLEINTNSKKLDGDSLLPLIEGREKKERTFLSDLALRRFKAGPTLIATNKENFKFILNKKTVSPYINKIAKNLKGMKIELYDLEKDPKEKNNLAQNIKYKELCSRLLRQIEREYKKIEKFTTEKEQITLDDDLRERLRALGYIK